MNFNLLKYNIGAAITLTMALWAVEESPVLKKESEMVQAAVKEVKEKFIPPTGLASYRKISSVEETENESMEDVPTDPKVKAQIKEAMEKNKAIFSNPASEKNEESEGKGTLTSSNKNSAIDQKKNKNLSNVGNAAIDKEKDKDKDKKNNPSATTFAGGGSVNSSRPTTAVAPISPTTAAPSNPNSQNPTPTVNIVLGNNDYNGLEDTVIEGVINYNQTAIKADSCVLTLPTNLTLESACSCVQGNCTFKIKPQLNFNGTTSFNYSLTKGTISKVGVANVVITSVEDPTVISAISDSSLYIGEEKTVTFTVSDVDTPVSCNDVIISSTLPSGDFNLTGDSNCSLKIKPSDNVSLVNSISLALGTATKTFNLTTIGITSLSLEEPKSPVPQYYKQTAKVYALYDDLAYKNVTALVNYESVSSKVTFTGSDYVASSSGSDTIKATYYNKSATRSLVIKPWLDLTLSSTYVKMAKTEEYKLNAVVLYADGTNYDVTSQLNLTKQSNKVDLNQNQIKALANGLEDISVNFGNMNKFLSVEISDKTLVSLQISGPSAMNSFSTAEYKVIAEYSDSTTSDVTYSVSWESDSSEVLQVNAQGQAFALMYGQAYLSAKMGNLSADKQVNVNNYSLQQISILPANYLASSGEKIVYKAQGLFSNGDTADISHEVTWSILNSALGTFNKNYLTLSTVAANQSTKVKAVHGTVNAETNLMINPITITSLIIPANISLAVGDKYKIKVYAMYADGAVVEVTQFAQWTTSNATVLGVSNSSYNKGEVSAHSLGTANLMVTYGASSLTKSISVSTNSIVAQGTGLKGEYYSGLSFNTFVGQRIDKNVNFDWASATKAANGLTDNYSVRWTGKIKSPFTGNMTLCTDSDDGVRLMRDTTYIINNWTDHGLARNCSSAMAVTTGDMINIKLEFYEKTGSAVIKLYWKQGTGAESIIPQSALFPN